MRSTRRTGLTLLTACSLLLSGCGRSFSDFVNYGFSQNGIRAVFEFFGGATIETEVEPLSEAPVIILGNGIPESASVAIPDGPFILPVGNPFAIGGLPGESCLSRLLGWEVSELSGIIRYDIDADKDDNDAEQMLVEIVTGRSGAFFDYDTTPGIAGVTLSYITPDRYTLTFADGNATDTLTLTGDGVRAILQDLSDPANATDMKNALSLIDTRTGTVVLGSTAINPVYATVGCRLDDSDEIGVYLEAVLREQPTGIRLVGAHDESVSLFVTNPRTETRDLFIFYNSDGPVTRFPRDAPPSIYQRP